MSWTYRLTGVGLRAIGNTRPPTGWNEKVVSYDRGETVVGESIHISAIERLGREVEIAGSSGKTCYAPANLREILPNLHARYCKPQTRQWPPEALSVTVWSGEVVHEVRSDAATTAIVDRAIRDAIGRLRRSGFDIEVDENEAKVEAFGRRFDHFHYVGLRMCEKWNTLLIKSSLGLWSASLTLSGIRKPSHMRT